jgi:hypothetical protein
VATIDTAEIGKALLDKKWLALNFLGVAVFVFAASGGFGWVQLHDFVWRVSVAVLGILLVAIGMFGTFAIREDDDPQLRKNFGVKITGPGDNGNVGDEFTLEGTYEQKPPETASLRAFIYSPYSGNYWPAGHKVQFFEDAKRWSVQIRPGGAKGDSKVAGIAVLGKNAQLLCKHYDTFKNEIMALRKKFNVHIGLPGIPEMPRDWKELKTIRITRR